jgi:5-formyltetrahydrofolate cyclo-ligase
MKEDREALRQKILGARDGLSDKVRQAKSISVMQNFWTLLGMQQWSTLFIYVNFRSEVETLELIKKCINRDIRVAVPLVEASAVRMIPLLIKDPEQDLVPGYYNIPEPDPKKSLRLEPGEIDAAVIPGSVFDIHGGRLGYALEPHDQPLDILITEERIVNITR